MKKSANFLRPASLTFYCIMSMFLLFSSVAKAQYFNWAFAYGNNGSSGYSVTTDQQGNMYAVGEFRGGIGYLQDFDPGPGIYNLYEGNGRGYIVKFDASRNLIWAKNLPVQFKDISIDNQGNVFVVGSFGGNVDMNPGTGTANVTATGGAFGDGFVLKLNNQGEFVWVKQMVTISGGGTSPSSLDIDESGNIAIAGGYSGTVDFDPGINSANFTYQTTQNNYSLDAFLLKLDANGNYIWASTLGTVDGGDEGKSVDFDSNGNLYFSARAGGNPSLTFSPGSSPVLVPTTSPYLNAIILKFSSGGSLIWAKAVGTEYQIEAQSSTVDTFGNVIMTGYWYGNNVDFDPGPGVYNLTGEAYDNFVWKLNTNGEFVFAKNIGAQGANFRFDDKSFTVATDNSGNIYVGGLFGGNCNFGNGISLTGRTGGTGGDGFIAKINPLGTTLWAKPFATIHNDAVNGLAVSSDGSIYATGYFGGQGADILDFNPGPGVFNLYGENFAAFTLKLGATPPAPDYISGPDTVCANTSATYTIPATESATSYNWIVPAGATLVSGQNTLSIVVNWGTSSGSISVTAINSAGSSIAKILPITVSTTSTIPSGISITGIANVCGYVGTLDSVTYSTATIDAVNYLWSVSNSTTMALSTVRNGSSVKIKYSAAFTSGTITLVLSSCNGSTLTKTFSVNKAIPGAPSNITGGINTSSAVTYICPYIGGANVTYVAAPPATNASVVTAYRWSLPAGSQLVSVNATDSSSITIRYPARPTTLTLSVLAVSRCGNSAAKSITLNATAPATPSTITGLTDVCPAIGTATQSTDVTYSVAAVNNAASYLWSVPSGATITYGQGGTAINVKFPSSFVSGNITVQSISPCGNSAVKSLTVYKRVAAAPATVAETFNGTAALIAAKTSVCGYSSAVYRIRKVTYATSYLWTMKNGTYATITHASASGINDTAVTVSFLNGFTKDSIQVQALTACSVSALKITALSAMSLPPSVSSISGSLTPCIGTAVTYVASAPAPTSTQIAVSVFRWTKPNNTTITSASADSSSVTISFNTGYTGGAITAKAQTACGVTSTAKSITLAYLTPTPSSVTSSTALYNACIGDVITYTAVVAAPTATQVAAVVYRWTKPNNTSIISATADSMSVTLQFNTGYIGGSVTVKGQTACGALGTAKSQAITHTGCPTGTRYLPVTRSTTPTIDSKDFNVTVFPNPTSTMFTLSIEGAKSVSSVRVLDLQGRVLRQKKINPNEKIKFGSELSPGVYMLEVREGESMKTVKVMKN